MDRLIKHYFSNEYKEDLEDFLNNSTLERTMDINGVKYYYRKLFNIASWFRFVNGILLPIAPYRFSEYLKVYYENA